MRYWFLSAATLYPQEEPALEGSQLSGQGSRKTEQEPGTLVTSLWFLDSPIVKQALFLDDLLYGLIGITTLFNWVRLLNLAAESIPIYLLFCQTFRPGPRKIMDLPAWPTIKGWHSVSKILILQYVRFQNCSTHCMSLLMFKYDQVFNSQETFGYNSFLIW